jgi:alpha-beta hydrolase superfamily lysophospholipase
MSWQDGYHELHNEPDGVANKFLDECIQWAEGRLPEAATSPPNPTARL